MVPFEFIKFQGVNMQREIKTDSILIAWNDRFWVRRYQINLNVYQRHDKNSNYQYFNKNIMNFHAHFPRLRGLSGCCNDYTSLQTFVIVGALCWYAMIVCDMCNVSLVYHVSQTTVKNVTSTEAPNIGMYRFSCFTAYTISQNCWV